MEWRPGWSYAIISSKSTVLWMPCAAIACSCPIYEWAAPTLAVVHARLTQNERLLITGDACFLQGPSACYAILRKYATLR